MEVTLEQLAAFKSLFSGRQDAYGQYAKPRQELAGEKRLAERWTAVQGREGYEPLADFHWMRHLTAEMGLGIVPVQLDGLVRWFAFDVDKYDELGDALHIKLVKRIDKIGIPMVVTRSKSGGAHCWCFLTAPIPAADAIDYLKAWRRLMGFADNDKKVELFPKQKSVEDMDAGSWVNLPYFGGHEPYDNRVCIGPRGQALTFPEFLRFAASRRIAPEDLGRVGHETEAPGASIPEQALGHQQAPPCVQAMMAEGVGEGGRNSAAYQLAVYLQKSDPDNWKGRLHEECSKIMSPPLPYTEVARMIGSMQRQAPGTYRYKCDEQPMASLCDRARCVKLTFGIMNGADKDLDHLTGFDLIKEIRYVQSNHYYTFILHDGADFTIDAEDMFDKKLWEKLFYRASRKVPFLPKKLDWKRQVQDWTDQSVVVDIGEALSRTGVVMETFREWVRKWHAEGNSIEMVLEQRPVYLAEEPPAIYFRGADFASHLRTFAKVTLEPRHLLPIIEKQMHAEEVRRQVLTTSIRLFRVPCPEPWFDVAQKMGLDDEGNF